MYILSPVLLLLEWKERVRKFNFRFLIPIPFVQCSKYTQRFTRVILVKEKKKKKNPRGSLRDGTICRYSVSHFTEKERRALYTEC